MKVTVELLNKYTFKSNVLIALVVIFSLYPPSKASVKWSQYNHGTNSPISNLHYPTLPYILTPERQALLNTIRYAEGTWKNGDKNGYKIIFGGQLLNNYNKHPRKIVVDNYASAAAGAYQFIPSTWNEVAKELNLPDFHPKYQDQAAIHLAYKRNALKEIDSNGLTTKAMEKLAYEWASFPRYDGKSVYGQPVKSHHELSNFYKTNLKYLRNKF